MTLDSTRGERSAIELPKHVIAAEHWLRQNEPKLYVKISGYRNRKRIDELEMSVIQSYVALYQCDIGKAFSHILQFINCGKVEPIPDDVPVIKIASAGELDSERYREIHHRRVS
jgi:hypothetical protein